MRRFGKTMVAAAAALVLCAGVLAGSNTALADSIDGFFKDIMRGTAVVGTEYADATAEVAVSVADAVLVRDGNVYVTLAVDFKNTDSAPFAYIQQVTMGDYVIVDHAGKEVVRAAKSDGSSTGVMVSGGAAELELAVSSQLLERGGSYTLKVDSLWGLSKADAPLKITGTWTAAFTVR